MTKCLSLEKKGMSFSFGGVCFVVWWFLFFETWFLCVALGCPRTHSVNHTGLKLGDPLASANCRD